MVCSAIRSRIVCLWRRIERTRALINGIPCDGLRTRFAIVNGDVRFQMHVNRDGFAAEKPVNFTTSLDRISLDLENRSHDRHETVLTLQNLPEGNYHVTSGNMLLPDIVSSGNSEARITIQMVGDHTPLTMARDHP
jgi:hypothetical protein